MKSTMEVKIVKRNIIKPVIPTPAHLRTYKLSLLDQLMPGGYVPMVLFYPMNECTSDINAIIAERLERMKQSLSDGLHRFYPFAGKIVDDLVIDCNDEGVQILETEVNCDLSQVLSQPDPHSLHKLLPHDPFTEASHTVMVQVNIFQCGGMAIGSCTSHKFIDGPTSVTLLKAWSAAARGAEDVISPDFSAPSIFPQNPALPDDASLFIWAALIKFGKCVSRRFVFDASAVNALKAKAASSSFVERPSRVEAVSAFIWKCFMNACKARHGCSRESILSLAVNLRGKNVSPLSEYTIGNLIWIVTAKSDVEGDREVPCLVGSIREGIMKIYNDFMGMLEGDDGFEKVCKCLKELSEVYSDEGADYLAVTSLCKVGMYEADFGWGKPIWVAPAGLMASVYQNLVFFMETNCGDGIEAWVTLGEEDMAILERDKELLAMASMDPSPLDLAKTSVF